MKTIILITFFLTSLIAFGQNSIITDLWKLYQSKDYETVIENTKPYLEIDSLKVDLNLLLGRVYADKGDFRSAIPYLNYTLKNDPNNLCKKAWALSYLGTCYFMLQDYDISQRATMECFDLNRLDRRTKYAIDNAYKQILFFGFDNFYRNWKIVDSDNFRFHFQDMSESEIKNYILTREEAFQSINSFFNSHLPKKIDFFVWNSRHDAKKILKANLGFAFPDFCIVHAYYQQSKGHEITHVISNYTTKILNTTKFINEGVAVCFDHSDIDKLEQVRKWKTKKHKQIVIKDYWENGEKYSEEIIYPLAGLFVKELIDNFGKEKFLEFFKNQTYNNAKLIFGGKLDNMIEEFENKISA